MAGNLRSRARSSLWTCLWPTRAPAGNAALPALVIAAFWLLALPPSLLSEVNFDWVRNLFDALLDDIPLGVRESLFYNAVTGCLYGMFVAGVLGYALPFVLVTRLPRRILRAARSPQAHRMLLGARDAALVNVGITFALALFLEAGSFFFPPSVLAALSDAHAFSVVSPACQAVFAASLLTTLVFSWGRWKPGRRGEPRARIAGALLFELVIWVAPLAFFFAYAAWLGVL